MLISATLDPASVPRAIDLILSELSEVREHSLKESELDRVRETMIAHLEMEGDRLSSLLWRTIESELNFGRYLDVDEDLASVRALTAADVARTATEVLSTERAVLGICGDVGEVVLGESFGPETFVPYDPGAGDGSDDEADSAAEESN